VGEAGGTVWPLFKMSLITPRLPVRLTHGYPTQPRLLYHNAHTIAASINMACTLIKKKIKFSSFIRKFRIECSCKVIYEEGLPNIWGNAQIFSHIWGGRQSYMTLQLLHSEFPYIRGKLDFLFYQCTVLPPQRNNKAGFPYKKQDQKRIPRFLLSLELALTDVACQPIQR
jgi:hypothetical protein